MTTRQVTRALSRRQLDALRIDLERELERLRPRILAEAGVGREWDSPGGGADPADELASELNDRAELRRTQISEALDRIHQGSYGYCVLCKEPIPFERLEVVPETRACVTCSALNPWLLEGR